MNRQQIVRHKNGIATAFAIFGVGLALWSVGVLPRASSHAVYSRPVPAGPSPPVVAPLLSSDYGTIISLETIDVAMNEFEITVQSQARSDAGLKALGEEAIQSLAKSASLSLKPILLGSFESYIQSVKALGGDPPESRSLWDAGQEQFAMRPVSIEGVRVLRPAQRGDSVNITETKRLSTTNKYDIHVKNIGSTQIPSRYPMIASFRNKKMDIYEVRLPIKALAFKEPDIEINAEIGVDLAWDADARRWQPVQYLLYQPMITGPDGPDDALSPHVSGVSY